MQPVQATDWRVLCEAKSASAWRPSCNRRLSAAPRTVSLAGALSAEALAFYGARNTGANVLIAPSLQERDHVLGGRGGGCDHVALLRSRSTVTPVTDGLL